MRANKKILWFLCLTMFGPLNSAALDTTLLSQTCTQYSEELMILVKENSEEDISCTNVITRSATSLRIASFKIEQNDFPLAIVYLLAVEKDLRNMVIRTDSCLYYGAKVKPYIPMVMTIKKILTDTSDDFSSYTLSESPWRDHGVRAWIWAPRSMPTGSY